MNGPVASTEFRRIEALPRRLWQNAPDLEELRVGLTEMLRAPGGSMELRALQAAALREIYEVGGLFGPICVGAGKTLIALLASVVCEAKRPVLLVPASLRDQTLGSVLRDMRPHWKLHTNLTIISYAELSLEKNAELADAKGNVTRPALLDRLAPDMIISDECHMLKNPKSGRTRRVSRYMAANPHTTFVALSGTVASHSIMDYWHTIQWALKPANAPVPGRYYEAQQWSMALDERVQDKDRAPPGALLRFCEPPEPNPCIAHMIGMGEDCPCGCRQGVPGWNYIPAITQARRGFRDRLVQTPGVLATGEDRLGVSLRISERSVTLPPMVRKVVDTIEATWELPTGEIISEATDLRRHLRTALCGFAYRWDPPPPREWANARKAWAQYVRHRLQYNRKGLDTELQVWNECEREHGGPVSESRSGHCEWCAWRLLRDTFVPNVVPEWFSDYLLDDVAQWLKEPGIAWVEHIAFGKELARRTGVRFYGAGDSDIGDASGPVIASIRAHGQGKNLQQWDRNLVTLPPTAGKTWEQMLGRTHRRGQLSDTVTFEVYQQHLALVEAMEQAVADARFLEDSLGNEQRLLYCDRSVP
jgi:hypothetical protein